LRRRLGTLFYDDAEASDSADRTRRREALISLLLAEAFADAGRWELAFQHHRQALSTALACGLGEVRWRADFGLARAAEAMGDSETAVDYYKKTIAVFEASGLSLALTNTRAGFFRDKAPVYERLVRLLVRARIRRPQAGLAEEALAYVERACARSRYSPPTDDTPAARALQTAINRVSDSISQVQIRLQDDRLPASERKALLEKLAVAESSHWDLTVRARRSGPGPSSSSRRLPTQPGWIREAVPNEATAVVRYFLGAEESFAFLLTRSGVDVIPLPDEAEIRGLVERYRRFLTLRDGGEFKGWEGGARLARLLLGPFLARLGSGIRDLVVIPDGVLHHLPFEALVRDLDSRRFLIEDYGIRYAPALSRLIKGGTEPGPPDWKRDFAGIACAEPVTSIRLTGATVLRLPPLRGAAAEIRTAAAFFPPGRSTILDAGGEADFKALPLADFRVIHIAAHGLIDDRNWWRSALLLGRRRGGVEDGFLQPREIFPLRLSADLVVLSGCETGYGALEKGEGVLGLSLAFLSAGARSLLMSLWSVEDRATAGLIESFYRNWREGAPKSSALRQAKLEALRSQLRHPLYWAGLVLSGD
jgi:CHAT domain-containing protein